MTMWRGLFFKEWKMMRGFIYTALIIAFAACVISSGLPGIEIISAAIALGYTVVPLFILYSLNSEANQLGAFLHQPNRAYKLLLIKIGTGVLLSIVYLLITTTYLTILLMIRYENGLAISLARTMLGFSLSALLISLYPAAILIFLWQVYRIWRARFGGISMAMIIALLVMGNIIMNHLRESSFYKELTRWGKYSVQSGTIRETTDLHMVDIQVASNFYVGTFVFYGVLAIIYFGISCWLLDRKVGL